MNLKVIDKYLQDAHSLVLMAINECRESMLDNSGSDVDKANNAADCASVCGALLVASYALRGSGSCVANCVAAGEVFKRMQERDSEDDYQG